VTKPEPDFKEVANMRFTFVRKRIYRVRHREPRYFITASGHIRFNQQAVEKYLLPLLQGAENVMLGYDPEQNEVALAPFRPKTTPGEQEPILFRVMMDDDECLVDAKPFFDHLNLVLSANGHSGVPRLENDPNYGQYLVLGIGPVRKRRLPA
jgi:hypothetical protein